MIAPWGRFAVDPRFGEEASRRLHDVWVERAVREDQRILVVAEDHEGITGVATCAREPMPRIDFIGVVKPGTGAAMVLMDQFLAWADYGDTLAGQAAARNVAVTRFVGGAVRTAGATYLYHRWLDEDPR